MGDKSEDQEPKTPRITPDELLMEEGLLFPGEGEDVGEELESSVAPIPTGPEDLDTETEIVEYPPGDENYFKISEKEETLGIREQIHDDHNEVDAEAGPLALEIPELDQVLEESFHASKAESRVPSQVPSSAPEILTVKPAASSMLDSDSKSKSKFELPTPGQLESALAVLPEGHSYREIPGKIQSFLPEGTSALVQQSLKSILPATVNSALSAIAPSVHQSIHSVLPETASRVLVAITPVIEHSIRSMIPSVTDALLTAIAPSVQKLSDNIRGETSRMVSQTASSYGAHAQKSQIPVSGADQVEVSPFKGSLIRFMSSSAMIDFLVERDNLCDRNECNETTEENCGSATGGTEQEVSTLVTGMVETALDTALLGMATVMTELASIDDLGPYQAYEKLTNFFTVRPTKSEGSHLTARVAETTEALLSASASQRLQRSKSVPLLGSNNLFSGLGFSDMGEEFARDAFMNVPLRWSTTLLGEEQPAGPSGTVSQGLNLYGQASSGGIEGDDRAYQGNLRGHKGGAALAENLYAPASASNAASAAASARNVDGVLQARPSGMGADDSEYQANARGQKGGSALPSNLYAPKTNYATANPSSAGVELNGESGVTADDNEYLANTRGVKGGTTLPTNLYAPKTNFATANPSAAGVDRGESGVRADDSEYLANTRGQKGGTALPTNLYAPKTNATTARASAEGVGLDDGKQSRVYNWINGSADDSQYQANTRGAKGGGALPSNLYAPKTNPATVHASAAAVELEDINARNAAALNTLSKANSSRPENSSGPVSKAPSVAGSGGSAKHPVSNVPSTQAPGLSKEPTNASKSSKGSDKAKPQASSASKPLSSQTPTTNLARESQVENSAVIAPIPSQTHGGEEPKNLFGPPPTGQQSKFESEAQSKYSVNVSSSAATTGTKDNEKVNKSNLRTTTRRSSGSKAGTGADLNPQDSNTSQSPKHRISFKEEENIDTRGSVISQQPHDSLVVAATGSAIAEESMNKLAEIRRKSKAPSASSAQGHGSRAGGSVQSEHHAGLGPTEMPFRFESDLPRKSISGLAASRKSVGGISAASRKTVASGIIAASKAESLGSPHPPPTPSKSLDSHKPPKKDDDKDDGGSSHVVLSVATPFPDFEIVPARSILKQSLGGVVDIPDSDSKNKEGSHVETEVQPNIRRQERSLPNFRDNKYHSSIIYHEHNADEEVDLEPNPSNFPTDFVLPSSTVPTPILTPDFSEHDGFLTARPLSEALNQYDQLGRTPITPTPRAGGSAYRSLANLELREINSSPFVVSNPVEEEGYGEQRDSGRDFQARDSSNLLPSRAERFRARMSTESQTDIQLTTEPYVGFVPAFNPGDEEVRRPLYDGPNRNTAPYAVQKKRSTRYDSFGTMLPEEEEDFFAPSPRRSSASVEVSTRELAPIPEQRPSTPDFDREFQHGGTGIETPTGAGAQPTDNADNVGVTYQGLGKMRSSGLATNKVAGEKEVEKKPASGKSTPVSEAVPATPAPYELSHLSRTNSRVHFNPLVQIGSISPVPLASPVRSTLSFTGEHEASGQAAVVNDIPELRPTSPEMDVEEQEIQIQSEESETAVGTGSPELVLAQGSPSGNGVSSPKSGTRIPKRISLTKIPKSAELKVNLSVPAELESEIQNSFEEPKPLSIPAVEVENEFQNLYEGGATFENAAQPQTQALVPVTAPISNQFQDPVRMTLDTPELEVASAPKIVDEFVFSYSREEMSVKDWAQRPITTPGKPIQEADVIFSCTLTEISNNDGNQPDIQLEVDGEVVPLTEAETSVVQEQVAQVDQGEESFNRIAAQIKKLAKTANPVAAKATNTSTPRPTTSSTGKPRIQRQASFARVNKNLPSTSRVSIASPVGRSGSKPIATPKSEARPTSSRRLSTPSASGINRPGTPAGRKGSDDKSRPRWR